MASNDKVSMPMSSAGIIGFSSDIKISGKEIDPKIIVAVVLILVVAVKAASLAMSG